MTPIWLAEPLIEVLVQPVQRVKRLIIDPPINDGGQRPVAIDSAVEAGPQPSGIRKGASGF